MFRSALVSFRFFCNSSKSLPRTSKEIKEFVPRSPYKSKIDQSKIPSKTKFDKNTIALLEKVSLVNCSNKDSIRTLEDAVAFADQIQQVDVTGIDPLITVLEDRYVNSSHSRIMVCAL